MGSDAEILVLFQCDIVGFSVPVVFRSKTQCAGNGPVLAKHCNAAVEHYRSARRVGLSASMAALRLLRRTMAIRFEARLALNADMPTEPDNITLKEYQVCNLPPFPLKKCLCNTMSNPEPTTAGTESAWYITDLHTIHGKSWPVKLSSCC